MPPSRMPQVAGDRRYLAKTGCAALWTCATASAGASLGLVRLSDDHHQRGMRDPIAPSLPHLIDGLRSAMIIFSETSRIATAPRSRTFAIGGVFWPYGILFTFVRGGAVEYQIAGNLEDEDIVMRHILMRHIVSITAFVVVLVLIGFGSRDNGGASGAQLDDSKDGGWKRTAVPSWFHGPRKTGGDRGEMHHELDSHEAGVDPSGRVHDGQPRIGGGRRLRCSTRSTAWIF